MIQRVPEPELMDDIDQVAAYGAADFNAGDDHTLSLILSLVSKTASGASPRRVIDLGCGPGNITLRLCDAFPESEVIGVDGAAAMLHLARARAATMHHPPRFMQCSLQQLVESDLVNTADLIVSNSLLHHLHQPDLLWSLTSSLAVQGCRVLHRDLRRPFSVSELDRLQRTYLPEAPAVLIQDFRASLAAAFEPDEVTSQLKRAGLNGLRVEAEDDRYLVVSGLVD